MRYSLIVEKHEHDLRLHLFDMTNVTFSLVAKLEAFIIPIKQKASLSQVGADNRSFRRCTFCLVNHYINHALSIRRDAKFKGKFKIECVAGILLGMVSR